MAITDDQMETLRAYAEQVGKDGVHSYEDTEDQVLIDMVFEHAETMDMRTQDEFDAVITEQDMPASEDRDDLIEAWRRGDRLYTEQFNKKDHA